MDNEELLRLLKEFDAIPPSSKDSDERTTPDNLFKPLDEEFHFTLDVCATPENHKCNMFMTKKENGLVQPWKNNVCFMNPPYSNISAWLNKAERERFWNKVITVGILPCDTSTKWFHTYLWNEKIELTRTGIELRFPKGRFKFGKYTTSPQFATIIAVFRSVL